MTAKDTIQRIFQAGSVLASLCLICVLAAMPLICVANNNTHVEEYDELLISVKLPGAGQEEIPGAIADQSVYLSVSDLFRFLRIKHSTIKPSQIDGFFIHPENEFSIDASQNRIVFKEQVTDLDKDAIILSGSAIYLKIDYFQSVFALQCKFSFRSLSIILQSAAELPLVREQREGNLRSNIGALKGDETFDTAYTRSPALFGAGMLDWSVIHTNQVGNKNDLRANVTLGGVVLGGETNVSINYRSNMPFIERQQFYQWRWVDNDNPIIKQIRVGKIPVSSVSTIVFPVVGAQLSNTPSIYRRSYGSYTIPYQIEAEWIAELYVNNTLIDYKKAEVSGTATFEVPMVYGYSSVKIRMISPWGEEKIIEQNFQLPFSFLPHNEFEYNITGGYVQDSVNSRFGRANANFGLTKNMTVGGGFEYLSSVSSGAAMPYINASIRLSPGAIVSGEHVGGVRSKLSANYRHKSNLQLELIYTKYKTGQKAIFNTFEEERKLTASFPFRRSKYSLFGRASVYQVVLTHSKYTTVESLISGMIGKVNTNFTTYAFFSGQPKPFVYSNLSVSMRLPKQIIFTPQVQYEYSTGKWMSLRAELGKYINTRGYCHLFVEDNIKNSFFSIGMGFKYDLSFAITSITANKSNQRRSAIVRSASGSIMYNSYDRSLHYSNRNNVGRSLLTLVPFLDINGNGKRDTDEPLVSGMSAKVSGGRVKHNRDTIIIISDLEAYTDCYVTLTESFENVSWRILKKRLKIKTDPNQYRPIDIPVAVLSEVGGKVTIEESGKPARGILVIIYNEENEIVRKTVTEGDGSFFAGDLTPGKYWIEVDPQQVEVLGLVCNKSIQISINPSLYGDFFDDLHFILHKPQPEEVQIP